MPSVLEVREARPPAWAVLAPLLYLVACAACIRAHFADPTADMGVAGLLVAVGLAPAFVLPAVFSSRPARLGIEDGTLSIDGRAVKVDALRVEPAGKGTARVSVELRDGAVRVFLVPDIREANALAARLPPVSAPAGALAA